MMMPASAGMMMIAIDISKKQFVSNKAVLSYLTDTKILYLPGFDSRQITDSDTKITENMI